MPAYAWYFFCRCFTRIISHETSSISIDRNSHAHLWLRKENNAAIDIATAIVFSNMKEVELGKLAIYILSIIDRPI